MFRPLCFFFVTLIVSLTLVSDFSYAISDCVYSGVNFSNGAVSCQSGQQFRCSDGDWKPLDLPCAGPLPAPTVDNPALCSCTAEEDAACDQKGEGCCVSVDAGKCTKGCCAR